MLWQPTTPCSSHTDQPAVKDMVPEVNPAAPADSRWFWGSIPAFDTQITLAVEDAAGWPFLAMYILKHRQAGGGWS
jgi:hypothetical protein